MPRFLLSHGHRPEDCRSVYAAWNGYESPLRGRRVMASCATGGHRMFWSVEADDEAAALAQLPPFVAERTEISNVREVPIP